MKFKKCFQCEKGNLIKKHEKYRREIGNNRFIISDDVEYFQCDNPNCNAKIFLGNESKKLDATSVKNLLLDVLKNKRTLNGDDVYYLRTFFLISARQLSLCLRYESSTVSNWEGKNMELDFSKSIIVCLFFCTQLKHKYPEFIAELNFDSLIDIAFDMAS
jgi:DNA-binding transcriptional regulator YiaG